jgi:hypothetical protein
MFLSGCKFDGRGGYVVFYSMFNKGTKKMEEGGTWFVADSNEIAVSYCLG